MVLIVFSPFCGPSFIPYHLVELRDYVKARGFKGKIDLYDLNINLFNSNISIAELPVDKNYFNVIFSANNDWIELQKKYDEAAIKYLKADDVLFEKMVKNFYSVNDYSVIAFSVTFHQKDSISQLFFSLASAKYIKQKYPDKKVVFGGSFFNHIDVKQLLDMFPFIDVCFLKESEESFFQWISGETLSSIPNISYVSDDVICKTEIKNNVIKDIYRDLDFSGIDFGKYLLHQPMVSLQYKRGCPYSKCNFCSQNLSYFEYSQIYSDQLFFERIEQLVEKEIRYFFIADQMLMKADLNIFIREIFARKINIRFAVMLMPNKCYDLDFFELLYQAGCRWIIWGVESASQNLLKKMNKPVNPLIAEQNIVDSHLSGIKNIILMIAGYPGETKVDIKKSKQFLEKLKPYYYDNSASPYFYCYGSKDYYDSLEVLERVPVIKVGDKTLWSNLFIDSEQHDSFGNIFCKQKDSIPYAEHMLYFCDIYESLDLFYL